MLGCWLGNDGIRQQGIVSDGDTDGIGEETDVKKARFGCIAALLVAFSSAAQSPSDTSFPKPIHSELPIYPELARAAHIAGHVKLWFMVDKDGGTAEAGIISGNRVLSDAALSALKSWKFPPGSIRPDVRYETEFVYDLSVRSTQGE